MQWWRRIGSALGLDESVGKTYYSGEFAEMNSRAFLYRPAGVLGVVPPTSTVWFEMVPVVNLGLLFNRKRSGGNDGLGSTKGGSIGKKACDLIEGHPPDIRDFLMSEFIRRNKELLSRFHSIPWYVPESWGGVGLPMWGDSKDPAELRGPSELDLQIFRRVASNIDKCPPRTLMDASEWMVRQVAGETFPISRVRESVLTEKERQLSSETLSLIYARTAAVYSVQSLSSQVGRTKEERKLIARLGADQAKQRLRWNEKLWSPSLGKIPRLPEGVKLVNLMDRLFEGAPKFVDFIAVRDVNGVGPIRHVRSEAKVKQSDDTRLHSLWRTYYSEYTYEEFVLLMSDMGVVPASALGGMVRPVGRNGILIESH